MLKKSYLIVTALSFMVISPSFSMENEDEGSSPISTETPREKKTSKDAEPQPPSSQQDAEHKTPPADLKEDSPPSAKSSKQRRRWCCFGTEDDD